MNCKPGDIAVCVRPGEFNGWVFECLYVCGKGEVILPDGRLNVAKHDDCWVLRSLSGPVRNPTMDGGYSIGWYGTGPDASLRPLRDPDADVTHTTDREVAA